MDLGLDDYLYGRGVCVVEWAEKALSLMPPERLLIRLDYLSDTERRFRLEASGRRYSKIVSQVKKSPFR
jgi:tRNA threonylcarbamoyladenosine biosynthesis protein TsaE